MQHSHWLVPRCTCELMGRTFHAGIYAGNVTHVAQSFTVNGRDIALGFAHESSYEHKDNP